MSHSLSLYAQKIVWFNHNHSSLESGTDWAVFFFFFTVICHFCLLIDLHQRMCPFPLVFPGFLSLLELLLALILWFFFRNNFVKTLCLLCGHISIFGIIKLQMKQVENFIFIKLTNGFFAQMKSISSVGSDLYTELTPDAFVSTELLRYNLITSLCIIAMMSNYISVSSKRGLLTFIPF